MLKNFLDIFRKKYQTLNRIEMSKKNLLQNYKYLSSLNRKVKIASVLKSNAYGHGILEVAKTLDDVGTPFFCVDSLYEAYQLLKAGTKTPILIMGYTDPQNFKLKKLPFSYAVFDVETARILNDYQPGCSIHIFVDTGINREGIRLEDLPSLLITMKQFNNLTIDGLMSHLASADNPKDLLNKIQIKNFKKAREICSNYGIKPRWIHLLNSDGLLNNPGMSTYPMPGMGNLGNVARVGLALYGISSNPNLKPILTLKSKIIQIKKLQKGDRVGYGGTFTAKKDTIIGILPIGYYDGVDRGLSNKGFVKIGGNFCPIVGRVSMNITTVDISQTDAKAGDEVIVYSNNPKDKNSIENVTKLCKKIPYEILVNLAESTRRVVV